MSLQDKVAFITGGGSGIGRASALKLAAQGVKIGVTDVNVEGGHETVQKVSEIGGEAIFHACNVADAGQVEAAVNATVEAFGRLDIAFNNAGVGGTMVPADQLDEETWDLVIDINLKGVWLCMKYELPHMLKQEAGTIINVASLAGVVGFPYNASYGASKHGVIGLTKSVALEYARQGIRVNAICPGFTETPMVTDMVDEVPSMGDRVLRSSPMRRLGNATEIADAVVYLAGDTSTFVNGHALILDGGASAQ
jgi:NAD(P)-dependent dehydrogenase (short-subunit alcohol dehydrogenase family)